MKVEYEEVNNTDFFHVEKGRSVLYKWGVVYLLRCFYCGNVLSLANHNQGGMIHVTNGVVDIRGPGSHSLGSHILPDGKENCPAHYHIYNGEVVLDCGWKP